MKFRALDSGGDWLLGQGLGSYAKGQGAIVLDVATELRSWKGDCPFAPTDGLDYRNLLEKGQQKNLEDALLVSIQAREGMVRVTQLAAKLDAARQLHTQYGAQSVYSKKFTQTVAGILGAAPAAGG